MNCVYEPSALRLFIDSGQASFESVLINNMVTLLVMITFIQVNTRSYRACKKTSIFVNVSNSYSMQLFFIKTNNKRKHERCSFNSVLRNRKKKAKQKV